MPLVLSTSIHNETNHTATNVVHKYRNTNNLSASAVTALLVLASICAGTLCLFRCFTKWVDVEYKLLKEEAVVVNPNANVPTNDAGDFNELEVDIEHGLVINNELQSLHPSLEPIGTKLPLVDSSSEHSISYIRQVIDPNKLLRKPQSMIHGRNMKEKDAGESNDDGRNMKEKDDGESNDTWEEYEGEGCRREQ